MLKVNEAKRGHKHSSVVSVTCKAPCQDFCINVFDREWRIIEAGWRQHEWWEVDVFATLTFTAVMCWHVRRIAQEASYNVAPIRQSYRPFSLVPHLSTTRRTFGTHHWIVYIVLGLFCISQMPTFYSLGCAFLLELSIITFSFSDMSCIFIRLLYEKFSLTDDVRSHPSIVLEQG